MAGIGLLHNPKAKRNATDPAAAGRLNDVLGNEGVVRYASTREELTAAAEEFKRVGVEVLAIGGGDGTSHLTITGIIDAYGDTPLPAFGFLRGGTMNTIANSFRIPRRPPEALLASYKRSYAGRGVTPMRFVEPHVMRIANQYGFIFGTGAIYGFIAEYNRRDSRDVAWAAKVLATAMGSAAVGGEMIKRVAQRWRGSVRFDDGSAFPEESYLSIGASTSGQMGLGFRPFYRSGESPQRFHMLGIFASPLQFIAGLPNAWLGRTMGAQRTYEKLVERAVLHPSDGVTRYVIDGDVYVHDGPLEIACGPQIRLVMPDL